MPIFIGILYLLFGHTIKINTFLGRFVLAKMFSGNHNKVNNMTYSIRTTLAFAVAGAALMVASTAAQALDVDAAKALAKAAEAAGKVLPVLIQLNISPAERFGCLPADAPALAEAIRSYPSLRLDGVMAIGPLTSEATQVREAFALAAKTFRDVGGSTLSIGMSGDWRDAVRAGSTMIRIGTALFGERPRQ